MHATDAFDAISAVDAIVICVPTPLNAKREPDLGPVLNTGAAIAPHIRAGQLIVLNPAPIPARLMRSLRASYRLRLKADEDYFGLFARARDPVIRFYDRNDTQSGGADCAPARELALALYESIIEKVVPVSSTRAAEAVKLTENIAGRLISPWSMR